MRLLALLVIFISPSLYLTGQNDVSSSQLETDLLFYADVMYNGFEASTRVRAASEFELLFDQLLSERKSISDDLPYKKYLHILPSPNNDFTLISWMIKLADDNYDYKGYILIDDKTIKLNRTNKLSSEVAYSTSKAEDWYGCIYNQIAEHSPGKYLIYGYDATGKYDNQRLIDVLNVNDGNISFGAPIFEDPESLGTYLNRLVINFSADASVILEYHPGLKRIIHDHFQKRMGQLPGQGPTHIPDGTYEGYEKVGDKWMYREKLFHHTYQEDHPPRPKPIFDDKPTEQKKRR